MRPLKGKVLGMKIQNQGKYKLIGVHFNYVMLAKVKID